MSGIIILPILIIYILFAVFIYKLTTSKILLILILIFPFWDLILQKGVKTYYQAFKMEPKIYAMPEFDKNGKVESLGLEEVTQRTFEYFKTDKDFQQYKDTYKTFLKKISQFSEITTSLRNNKTQLVRIFHSNKSLKKYEVVDKQLARYQIVTTAPKAYFFGLYKKRYYRLIDTNKGNKVLAEAFEIRFTDKYAFFRRNILWWQTGTGGNMVYVQKIDNLAELFEKVLSIKVSWLTFNTNKGWK